MFGMHLVRGMSSLKAKNKSAKLIKAEADHEAWLKTMGRNTKLPNHFKTAYEKVPAEFGLKWKKVRLTGRTKVVRMEPYYHIPKYYIEIEGWIWNKWVCKNNVGWFDQSTEEIYELDTWRNK
jgi:hypothetical protein